MKAEMITSLVLVLTAAASAQAEPHGLVLHAADKTAVFARLYPATGKAKAIILMFHQARSNMAEYAPIAPRVAKMGFDCLTIDQRAGDGMWGVKNKTAAQFSSEQNYLQAYPDLEAALAWAKLRHYQKIIAWGSSYSSSLTLRLASEHPEIAAALVFSPGEYFDQDGLVAGWNQKIKVPVLFAWTQEEADKGGMKLFQSAKRAGDVLVVGPQGVHASSTLRADRNPNGAEYYWERVEKFLKAVG